MAPRSKSSPSGPPSPGFSDSEQVGPWQEQLHELCSQHGFAPPVYHIASDRRGSRTAWSCVAEVNGNTYNAIFWYDGNYIGNAKEDSAQVAYMTIATALTRS